MTLSILIPVYNSGKTLEKCVLSVLKDIPEDTEVVILDDASTDNSLETARALAVGNPNIRILRNRQNMGVGKSRNRLIREARGEYVFFLDADDCIDQNLLREMLSVSDDSDIVAAPYVHGKKIYKVKKEIYTSSEALLEGFNSASSFCSRRLWGKLIKKELLLKNPIPELRICEDEMIYPELWLSAGKIKAVRNSYYYYRGSSLSSNSKRIFLAARFRSCLTGIKSGIPAALYGTSGLLYAVVNEVKNVLLNK